MIEKNIEKVKNKMKKIVAVFACLSVCAVAGTLFVGTRLKVSAQEAIFNVEQIPAECIVNDTFEVPYGEATLDNRKHALSHKVRYPSGYCSPYDDILLSEQGEYVITYYFTENGKTYSKEVSFNAVSKTQSLFVNKNDCEISSGVNAPAWSDYEFNGVSVNFKKSGASVVYDGLLNLNNFSSENHFIEYIVTPSESGVHTINSLTFTLTDVNDSDNYLVINSYPADLYGLTNMQYIRTAPCGKYSPAAWVGGTAQKRGYAESSSYNGKVADYKTSAVRLSYVSSLNASYSYASPYDADAIHVLLDYDDPNQVGKDNVWSGFSNNYVKLTITADKVIGTGGSVLITSINGRDLKGTNEIAADNYDFLFETHGYSENSLPTAVVGKTYEVFAAKIMDDYGRLYDYDVSARDSRGNAVAIENGYFTPTAAGSYYLKYRVRSSSEVVEKELKITASNQASPDLKFVFNENMDDEYFVGDVMKIGGEASGGVGFVNVSKRITLNEEELPISNLHGVEYIRFDREGDYVVEYVLTDMLKETAVFYKHIDVKFKSRPQIITPPVNRVGLVNRKMTFPKTYAYIEQSSGNVYYDVQVLLDGTDITDSLSFTPTKSGNHTLVYRAKCPYDESITTELYYEITIGDPSGETVEGEQKQPYIAAFMYLDNFTQKYDNGAYRLTAQGLKDSAYMQFKTPIPISSLSFNFLVEETKNEFDGVKVYFTDSVNPSQKIECYVKKAGSEAELYINGIYAGTIVGSFDGTVAESFALEYDNLNKSIRDYSGKNYLIETYTDWKNFKGFDSGLAILSLELVGIKGDAEIKLGQLANQYFVADGSDDTKPIVVFEESYASALVGKFGEDFALPKGKAYDVLSENVKLNLVVTSPTLKILYRDEYKYGASVKLTEIGRYSVTYTAEDESGNTQKFLMSIYVYDVTSPTIEVSGVSTSVKAGTTVSLPAAQVSDDCDEFPYLITYVRSLIDNSTHIVNGGTYVFKESGKYEIIYYATDSANNVATKSFIINVE